MNDTPQEYNTGLTRADLGSKQSRFLRTPWGEFALYESEGVLYCALAFCPHMEGPLFEGSILNGIVTCPWHSWRFRLEDGCRVGASEGDSGEGNSACRLTTCALRIEPDGTIVLSAPVV